MRSTLRLLSLALALAATGALAAGCGGDDNIEESPDGGGTRDAATPDGGPKSDAGPRPDGGPGPDAGPIPDAGPSPDAGPTPDGGPAGDGGTKDFSVFVKDLIDNHTNAKDPPADIPPDTAFTDNMDQANYPPAYFP